MTGLIELRITNNQPKSLPDSVGLLLNLRELHARNNMLASLPVLVGTLRNLHQLDLRGNPLTNLPESIAGLPSLQKLDLRWVESLDLTPWINAHRGARLRCLSIIWAYRFEQSTFRCQHPI
jgi:Leucine-rich repeat (LRR) protein